MVVERTCRPRRSWIAVVVALLVAKAAVAAPSDGGGGSALDEAFQLLDEGEYAVAREKFAAQVAESSGADATFGLARSEQMLRNDPAALLAFRRWLRAEKLTFRDKRTGPGRTSSMP